MVGFVNDSMCITNGDSLTTYDELKQWMTKDAQLWHNLLWTSGGKLELSKCGYHLFDYEFDKDGLSQMQFTPNCNITLEDQNNNAVVIKAKSIFEPRKNLGHHKAPSGTNKMQFKTTLARATQLTDDIVVCRVNQEESYMLVNMV